MLMSFVNLQARYRSSYVNKYAICKQVQAITLFILLENVNERFFLSFFYSILIFIFVRSYKKQCLLFFIIWCFLIFLSHEFCISLTHDLKNWHSILGWAVKRSIKKMFGSLPCPIRFFILFLNTARTQLGKESYSLSFFRFW